MEFGISPPFDLEEVVAFARRWLLLRALEERHVGRAGFDTLGFVCPSMSRTDWRF